MGEWQYFSFLFVRNFGMVLTFAVSTLAPLPPPMEQVFQEQVFQGQVFQEQVF